MPRRSRTDTDTPKPRRPVMQASAVKMDPGSAFAAAIVKATKNAWNERAWIVYDSCGPIKGGARFVENASSLVEIELGIIPGLGEDPVPLHDAIERGLIDGAPGSPDVDVAKEDPVVGLPAAMLAEELTQRLLDGQESPGALLAGWGNKSFISGEAYFVAYVDPVTSEERWLCLSTDELIPIEGTKEGQPKFKIRRIPRVSGSGSVAINSAAELVLPVESFMMRVWRPHGRYHDIADSNLRSCLAECEELSTLNATIKAAATSRIPAGILYVSSEIVALASQLSPAEMADEEVHPLVRDLLTHQTTPVRDPSSASSLTPFLMTGPAEVNGVAARDMIFTIDLGRTLDPEVIARARYLIEFIASTVELPQERLTGMSDSNHWTAWQVDEETYRLYIGPIVDVPLAALTKQYLRARLIASDVDPREANRFVYIADNTTLVTRPNRAENAKAAHVDIAISDEALRDALGFGDDDAPTADETVRRIVQRQTVLPPDVIPLLNQLLGTSYVAPDVVASANGGGTPAPPGGNTQAAPEEGAPPNDGQPTDSTTNAVTASGRRRTAGERLAAIDRRVRDRLVAAADAAAVRAVERAGARTRTKLSTARTGSDKAEARALLASVPNRYVAATLGRSRLVKLGIDPDDLLDAEFDDLHDRWDEWVGDAQEQANTIAVTSLGIENPDVALAHLRAKQDTNRRAGWAALALLLLAASRRVLFDPSPAADVSRSVAEAVTPSVVRYALGIAGGSQPTQTAGGGVTHGAAGGAAGGPATGDDMADLWGSFAQPWTGYVWIHDDPANEFPPHVDLDGVEFASWSDDALATSGTGAEWIGDFFFPGDHDGCLCDAAPQF